MKIADNQQCKCAIWKLVLKLKLHLQILSSNVSETVLPFSSEGRILNTVNNIKMIQSFYSLVQSIHSHVIFIIPCNDVIGII